VARFGGALAEARLKAALGALRAKGAVLGAWRLLLQVVEVAHGQFEDVGLLQLGHVFAFILQSCHHQLLQLVKTPIDSRPSLSFQQRFGDLWAQFWTDGLLFLTLNSM